MIECPSSKIFKATTGGRKPGHRPPVVALSRSLHGGGNLCEQIDMICYGFLRVHDRQQIRLAIK